MRRAVFLCRGVGVEWRVAGCVERFQFLRLLIENDFSGDDARASLVANGPDGR